MVFKRSTGLPGVGKQSSGHAQAKYVRRVARLPFGNAPWVRLEVAVSFWFFIVILILLLILISPSVWGWAIKIKIKKKIKIMIKETRGLTDAFNHSPFGFDYFA